MKEFFKYLFKLFSIKIIQDKKLKNAKNYSLKYKIISILFFRYYMTYNIINVN